MKRYKKAIIVTLSLLSFVIGLSVWASVMPVQLGLVWNSIEVCAENQQKLYQSLEFFVEENDRLPENVGEFKIDGFPAASVWKCPASQQGYDLVLENYGNPKAVLIADKRNAHPTTFMLWLRGLKPQVQTMGDGTIHLFEGGKIMTIKGSKK